jgi:Fe2+-dicitrate sensor, membrane component
MSLGIKRIKEMIHDTEFVRKLIRKSLEGVLTPREAALLKAARRTYDQEEWQNLMVEALSGATAKEQDVPVGEWEPDLGRIRKTVGQRKQIKKLAGAGVQLDMVAAAMLVLLVGYHVYHRLGTDTSGGGCAGIPGDKAIPTIQFGGTIRYGDSSTIRIAPGAKGRIARIGNITVDRDEAGTLILNAPDWPVSADTAGVSEIRFITTTHQQCEVLLPGGTRIRLNAESILTYPLKTPDPATGYARLNGEALVQTPEMEGGKRFIIETANSQLHTADGRFAVQAMRRDTRAVLLAGSLAALTRYGREQKMLEKHGSQVHVRTMQQLDGTLADSLFFRHRSPTQAAVAWTRPIRRYRDVPLKDFVADITRWYGIPFKNTDCIPASIRVNASLCYRAPLENALAVINRAGIRVYQTNGAYSFCEPDDGFHPSAAGIGDHRTACRDCGR